MKNPFLKVLLFWCASGLMIALIYTGLIFLGACVTEKRQGSADVSVKQSKAAESPQEMLSVDTGRNGVLGDAGSDSGKGSAAETEIGEIALTFDDGPHPVCTAKLLDGLKERGVHATFFVVGENIPGNEDLIERMEAEGHLIGNHTYDHVKISDLSAQDACRQVEKTSELVRGITGHHTEFVRPPFGAWKKNMECSFTMIPVLWDVDPLDWTTSDASLVVDRVVSEVEDQDIILMHDCYESSVQAALEIVDILRERGFQFVTADRLVLD